MPIPIILFFPLLSHPILVSGATGPCNGMVCALCLGVDTFGLVNLEQQSNIWARNLIECIQPRGASSVRKCGQPLPNARMPMVLASSQKNLLRGRVGRLSGGGVLVLQGGLVKQGVNSIDITRLHYRDTSLQTKLVFSSL